MVNESGLDTILSVFIRYSELSAVKYDVKSDTVKIETALSDKVDETKRNNFIDCCQKSMALFYEMTKIQPIKFALSFMENAGITILRLYRDGKTLQEQEMELFVRLLRQEFASLLIKDDNDIATLVNGAGDIKKTLMQKLHQSYDSYHNIFAYRDEGRVFVFNK
ncbi:MAG: hypothetical protein VB084_03340 [Syntrophomonadaceae bacterium]|nr:hypothetical protein [Syntrophomonadaceae bacterium]